ncbi:MAG: hypothetical protein ACREBU_15480, partial [Nitrososphaera sp.]
LLVYDFTRSPRENAVREEDVTNPENRGFILYPEENRRKGIYFIPAMSQEQQRGLTSPIAWSEKSDKLALLEGYQGNSYLVVIDISNGLLAPQVTKKLLNKERFYSGLAIWQPQYENAVIIAKHLTFTKNATSIELQSMAIGPFGEKTVILEIR